MITGPKFWAIGLLLGAFLAGAVLGGSVTAARGDNEEPLERGPRPDYSEILANELGLTAEQQQSVAAVLESTRPEMCAIWEEFRPRYEALRMGIRDGIKEVLTEAQIGAYEEMLARHDSVRAARSDERSGNRNGCED